jgi:hypothetical protein
MPNETSVDVNDRRQQANRGIVDTQNNLNRTQGDAQRQDQRGEEQRRRDEEADQRRKEGEEKISVKAMRFFQVRNPETGEHEMKNPESEPFEVSRHHAAELYANGLIAYNSEDEEKRMVQRKADDAAQVAKDRLAREKAARPKQAKPLVSPDQERFKSGG